MTYVSYFDITTSYNFSLTNFEYYISLSQVRNFTTIQIVSLHSKLDFSIFENVPTCHLNVNQFEIYICWWLLRPSKATIVPSMGFATQLTTFIVE